MKALAASALLTFLLAASPMILHGADNSGQAIIEFSKALLEFNDKNYAAAEQGFAASLENNPQHYQAAYFLGLSRFEQEDYQGAIDAFDKAIALRPQEPDAYFYRGVSLYRRGLRETALDDFITVSKLATDEELKREADAYVLNIESRDAFLVSTVREKPWFAYANVAFNYDSNVTLDPDDVTIDTLPSDQNDIQFFLEGGGGYHIVQKKNYRLTGEAYYSQTLYPDLNSFNFGLVHAELRNQFRFNKKNFFTIRAINEYSFLATSSYLESIQLHFGSSHYWSKRFQTRFGGFLDRNFFIQDITNPAQNRDAWNMRPGVVQYFYFRDGQTFFNVGYNFERNWATGSDWDYNANHLNVAFFTPIAWRVTTYLYADFIVNKNFDNVDSVFGVTRDDWAQNYGIQFSRPIHEYVTVRLHYSYYRNSSNIAVFQYDKHLGGLIIAFRI